ncbi:hypothetical protein E2542_SST21279 [Spatholobus suberectus]|nr:hypothetical protein E2542_SST21279 [Spatholobus suberectus]
MQPLSPRQMPNQLHTKFCYALLPLSPSTIFPIMAEYSTPMPSCHVDIYYIPFKLLGLGALVLADKNRVVRCNLCPLGKCLTNSTPNSVMPVCYSSPHLINTSSTIFPIMAEYSTPMPSCYVNILLCISQFCFLLLHFHA